MQLSPVYASSSFKWQLVPLSGNFEECYKCYKCRPLNHLVRTTGNTGAANWIKRNHEVQYQLCRDVKQIIAAKIRPFLLVVVRWTSSLEYSNESWINIASARRRHKFTNFSVIWWRPNAIASGNRGQGNLSLRSSHSRSEPEQVTFNYFDRIIL